MIPLYTNQLQQDMAERLCELRIIQSITKAEAQRLGKCFRMGLILVTYDHPGVRPPAYCVAKESCQFSTILQTLKHLA
jgi:hypothetical protein